MKHLIFFLFILINIVSCSNPKTDNINETSVDFVLNDCEATYKGKPLPFGKPVEEWVRIFGKYDRRPFKSIYIWDKLGIHVSESDDSDNIDELHIFFMNLESPLAEEGVLDFAEGYYMKTNKDPINYEYPFKIYTKPINIEGAEVKQGMKIPEINKERESRDLEPISFIDANMNGKVEEGPEEQANGYFSNYGAKNNPQQQREGEKKNFYHIMFRQTSGEVEYIRIVQDKGQEYFKY